MKIIYSILLLFSIQTFANPMQLAESSKKFLEKHCVDCHDEDVQKGDVRLDNLEFNFADANNRQLWTDVFDIVSLGEMPPKKKKRPLKSDLDQFLSSIEKPLLTYEKGVKSGAQGRIRRLNREEFQETLSNILQTDLNIVDLLPEDAQGYGFDTVGKVLNVSAVQIESYLKAIDVALDQATFLYEQPQSKAYNLSFINVKTLMERDRKTMTALADKDGMIFFSPQRLASLSPVMNSYSVPYPGRYKVAVTAQAVRSKKPLTLLVRMGDQGYSEGDDVPKTVLGYVDVREGEPQTFNFEADMVRGQYFRSYPVTLPFLRMGASYKGKQDTYQGPGIKVMNVMIDGPHYEQWPPASHKVLWGNTATKKISGVQAHLDHNKHLEQPPKLKAKPKMTRGKRIEGKVRNYYDPKQKWGGEPIYPDVRSPKPLHPTMEFAPQDPKKESALLIRNFLQKAFRKNVTNSQESFYIKLVHHWLDKGISFERALRTGYKAILTSPDFLYMKSAQTIDNDHGRTELNNLALAERLSFFLWSSGPDKILLDLAVEGKLSDDSVLENQVERMLKDSRSQKFINNFLGQWLDLRKIDFTTPDRNLYPEYRDFMKYSMVEETKAFINELINKDLSVLNVVDSDFVMINEELAKLYGIPDIKGPEIRKVTLPEGSVRGGVMTMASVLKVTANGTTTSPVVRGTWVLERIMGIHPPAPPSDVPAIEPDLNGAVTVLDQLKKHRESSKCSSCHALIDPPGVVLEGFDVIGGWRKNYRAVDPEKIKEGDGAHLLPDRPAPIIWHEGLPVVTEDQLSDGRKFKDIIEFKKLLMQDPEKIAYNVGEKLIIYGRGAELSFAERYELKEIIKKVESQNYGFKTFLKEIVKSEIFRRK